MQFLELHVRRFLLVWGAALLAATLPTHAATVFMSPAGNDAVDGLSGVSTGGHGPVATVAGALTRLKAMSASTPAGVDRIVLLPGEYELLEPIRIGPQSLRSNASGLVIEAQQPGTVVISGGRALGPFAAQAGKWVAERVAAQFDMLWVDGVRAVRARSPNGGRFFVGGRNPKTPIPEAQLFSVTLPNNIENARSLFLPEDAQAALRSVLASPTPSLQGIGFYAMHSWTSSAHDIKSFDASTGLLTVSPSSIWTFLLFMPGQRFAFDNSPAFLDEAGEWLLSSTGTFQYIPRAAQKLASAKVIAPRLERLVEISGTPDRPLKGIVLRGLRFSYTNSKLSPFIDSQAALKASTAVLIDYAENAEIDDCAFEHMGGYALWLRQGVTNSAVRRSLFDDLGAGGIRLGPETLAKVGQDQTIFNVVENNLIQRGGLAYPGGIGIWVGQSGQNRISNNELHSLNYTAISVGWTWGFGTSQARKNVIENNYIHDIGQGMMDDMGGIYTLGLTEGTLIRGNRIEDVTSYSKTGATAWGIYLDAGSSNITVEKNVVLRTTGGGFHLHYGHDDIVRNNIFAYSELAQVKRTGSGKDATMVFERNVLAGDTVQPFGGAWQDAGVSVGSNMLGGKATASSSTKLGAGTRAATTTGDAKALADPQLKCSKGDCQIDAATAAANGFQPFSNSTAGIQLRGAVLAR